MAEAILANVNRDNLKASLRMLEKRKEMILEQAKTQDIDEQSQRIIELESDEAFMKKLMNCDSAEKVQTLFKENGVDLSMEQVNDLLKGIGELLIQLGNNDGELTEDELEQIAGGWSWKGFVTGALLGVAVFVVGALSVAAEVGTAGLATPFVAAVAVALPATLGTVSGLIGSLLE